MSSFRIKTDSFKKTLQLIKLIKPLAKESVATLQVEKDKVSLEVCTPFSKLIQKLEATEINLTEDNFIVLPLQIIQKFKYPGKDIVFNLKANTIFLSSGNFKGKTRGVRLSKEGKFEQDFIDTFYSFNRQILADGLKFLSFKDAANKNKIVKIVGEDNKLTLITHDAFRGGCYCTECDTNNLDMTADLLFILDALPILTDDTIQIGCSTKQIVVKCENMNFAAQLMQVPSEIADVASRISSQLNTQKPRYAFDIDAKILKTSINSITSALNNTEEIRVYFKLIPGKKVKKSPEDKDTLKLYTEASVHASKVLASYSVAIDNVEGSGIYSVSNNLLNPLLLMDGPIRLYFYETTLVIQSLKYELAFMLPQLAVRATKKIKKTVRSTSKKKES